MDRGRVLPAVALVLAVVALGTVAGGLDGQAAADGERSPGVGIGSGDGSGAGEAGGFGFNVSNPNEIGFPPWFGVGLVLVMVWASAILAGAYAVAFLWDADLRDLIDAAVSWIGRAGILVLAVGALLLGLLALEALFSSGGGGLFGGSESAGPRVTGDATAAPSSDLVGAVLIVAVAGLLLVLFAAWLPSGDDGEGSVRTVAGPSEGESEGPAPTLTPHGDVDDPSPSNEVYRAWTDLRERVGDGDRTESPAEIARRAREAGVDEQAVAELTALFNAARYGGDGVSGDSERRARDIASTIDADLGRDGSEGKNV